MTTERPQKFKVKGSKVKVTARRNAGRSLPNCEKLSQGSNISLPKFRIRCTDDGALFSPNLVEFGPLRSRFWKYAPLKNIAKSSITQPYIDQSCLNLVGSLIT